MVDAGVKKNRKLRQPCSPDGTFGSMIETVQGISSIIRQDNSKKEEETNR